MSDQGEKKLFIDEDWKAKAQAEKAQLAEAAAAAGSSTASSSVPSAGETGRQETVTAAGRPDASPASGSSGPPGESAESARREPLPPASFATLISSLATQTLLALGQYANPETGQAELDLDYARHLIDTLAVLEDKTRNNLAPGEAQMLDAVLHKLRMAFVAIRQELAEARKQA